MRSAKRQAASIGVLLAIAFLGHVLPAVARAAEPAGSALVSSAADTAAARAFLGWIGHSTLPASPGLCVRSFTGSSDAEQNRHSHTWDNAVNGVLALALSRGGLADSVATFLASPAVWNAPYRGYFQAVSIDVTPPRANDDLDYYTKLGQGSAANIFLMEHAVARGRPDNIPTVIARVRDYITWLDAGQIPFFPEITAVRVTENNLVPFGDTPVGTGSLLYKSFEESMEFVVSLLWATSVTHEARYRDLGLAVFESVLDYFWDPARSTFFSGSSLQGGVYVKSNIVAFDVYSTIMLAVSLDPGFEAAFVRVTNRSSQAWFSNEIDLGFRGLAVSGACINGARFSDAGNMVAATEPTGDLLACLRRTGLGSAYASSWAAGGRAVQDPSGTWWAGYDPNTCSGAIVISGFGFSYDGWIAIGAKLALGLISEDWYDVVAWLSAVPAPLSGASRVSIACTGPNPFRGETSLSYVLPEGLIGSLEVFDIGGRRVAEVAPVLGNRGEQTERWFARDLPPGVYFVRLQSPSIPAASVKITVLQ